jgi:hypothetical protein
MQCKVPGLCITAPPLRPQAIGNRLVTERGYRLVNDLCEDRAMAKRNEIDGTSGEPAADADGASQQAQANSEIKNELPNVYSPPISLGTFAIEPIAAAPAIEPIATPAPASATSPRFSLSAGYKRNALLAASVALAVALGAVVGAVASGGFAAPARTDIAGLEERKAMQQSISRLTKEITTLKASIQAANKIAHTQQIAKNTERLDQGAIAEITGSIIPPQTTAPLPTPRPTPGVAALETLPARSPVVQDWTIRDARDGFVYVQGHGDIYQVVPGAPLPGLGPVQSIKRQDGRWVVLTPKGIIVSFRDRRYFETY